MSDIVCEFNPATAPQTNFTVPQTAANGAIVFWNESNISLNISLQNGTKFYLPAWYNKHLCGYSGNVNISWDVRTVLNSGLPPTSEIIVEAYAHGEHFPADGALVRQANGDTNAVTTQNTLINDGSAPNTIIIEATPSSGSSGSVLVADNSGHMTLGDATNKQGIMTVNGDIKVASDIIATNILTLGQSGTAANVLSANAVNTHLVATGAISLDINGTNAVGVNSSGLTVASGSIGQSTAGDMIDAPNFMYIKNGSKVIFQVPSGTSVAEVNNGGLDARLYNKFVTASTIQFTTGSITRVSTFTGTGTGPSTVSHGLGAIPDIVLLNCTSASSSSSFGYASATSTQVTIISGFNVNWKGLAIKF